MVHNAVIRVKIRGVKLWVCSWPHNRPGEVGWKFTTRKCDAAVFTPAHQPHMHALAARLRALKFNVRVKAL